MKKFLKLVLCGFLYACLFSSARSFKKLFKKLTNKKIANNVHSYENTNLFNCINRCEKEGSCKIFNYNPKMKICQLTDQEVDNDYKDAVSSYDWEVYIPVTQITKNDQKKRDAIEVIESKEKLQSSMKMDIYINVTNLSICFWIICLCMLSICLCLIILAKCSIRQNVKGHAVFGICLHIDSNGRYFIDSVFSGTRAKRMNVNFETNEYYHVCFVFFQQFSAFIY